MCSFVYQLGETTIWFLNFPMKLMINVYLFIYWIVINVSCCQSIFLTFFNSTKQFRNLSLWLPNGERTAQSSHSIFWVFLFWFRHQPKHQPTKLQIEMERISFSVECWNENSNFYVFAFQIIWKWEIIRRKAT